MPHGQPLETQPVDPQARALPWRLRLRCHPHAYLAVAYGEGVLYMYCGMCYTSVLRIGVQERPQGEEEAMEQGRGGSSTAKHRTSGYTVSAEHFTGKQG